MKLRMKYVSLTLPLIIVLSSLAGCVEQASLVPETSPAPTPNATQPPVVASLSSPVPVPTQKPTSPPSTPKPPSPTPTPKPTAIAVPPAHIDVTFKGDFPGGTERVRQAFERVYPYLVYYLGEPFTIGKEGITWIWDSTVTSPDKISWNTRDNSIIVGPRQGILDTHTGFPQYYNMDQQYDHETCHMFYDIGDQAIDFTFGQWIVEGMALIGQDLANEQVYLDVPKSVPTMYYDSVANLGWERVNGVLHDGDKYNRSIVDGNATVALRLMTEVLSFDTSLDYLRNVNAGVLAEYRSSGNPRISPEVYKSILNKAARGRTIDGMLPGDWLFKQPVANTNGATGIYVNVIPGHITLPPPSFPGNFEVAVFERQSGRNANEKREVALGNLAVTLTVLDASGKTVGQATVQTDNGGTALVVNFSPTSSLSLRGLPSGAYVVKAQTTVSGKQLEGANVFMILPRTMPLVQKEDDRMFIIPVNADGTVLRPELVERLQINGGKVIATQSGVLVISAETGANVEFSLGSFRAMVSKPISVRIVPLRIP